MLKEENKKYLQYIFAFVLPIVCMQICMQKMHIGYGGDRTILTWDLSAQYISFLTYLREILLGHTSATYTLVGGFGGGLSGMIAYYLGSPFNLFLLFFSKDNMPLGVALLIQMKVAFMGLFMYLFLQSREKSGFALFFSTAYSFCGYAVAYESNIMWLDALVFLPLVVWGMDRVLKNGKSILYVVALGLTIMSCYYTAYMVCLFCGLYFVCNLILAEETLIKEKMLIFLKFILHSLWAVSLSAFIFLPGVRQISGGARSGYGLNVITNWARLYFQQSLLPMFLACSYDDSQRWEAIGFPLVYCGILSVFGIISFLCSGNIKWRKKAASVVLLAFLFISYNHINLFIIWHGFYSPLGAPWRFAFLGSFFMVLTAYEGAAQIIRGERNVGKIAFAGMCLFLIWIYWRFPAYRQIVLFNALVFYGQCLCFLARKQCVTGKQQRLQKLIVFVGIICMMIELCVNALYTWNQGFRFVLKADYDSYLSEMNQVIKQDNYYRSELSEQVKRSENDGFLLGLNTLSIYSSTERDVNCRIRADLGFGESDFSGWSTVLSRKIAGLKYIYCDSAELGQKMSENSYAIDMEQDVLKGFYVAEQSENGICRLQDDNVLPLAYVVKPEAADWILNADENRLFENQNRAYSLLAGSDDQVAYVEQNGYEIPVTSVGTGEITCLGNELYTDGSRVYREESEKIEEAIAKTAETLQDINMKDASHMRFTINNTLPENAYMCLTVPYEKGWRAKVNGEPVKPVEGMGGFLLVPVEKGTSTVEVRYLTTEQIIGNVLTWIALLAIFFYKKFPNSPKTVRNRETICLKMGKRDRLGYFIHGHGVWGFFEKVKRRTHKQEADPASDGFQTQNEPEPL